MQPKRVLVADDSSALRTVVRVTVETQGWTALEAIDALEAVAIAREQHPDLILLDLYYPQKGPDGFAALRALRGDARTAGIPVIVLTGSTDPSDAARARAEGAEVFLTKPFGPLELINAMHRLLGIPYRGAKIGLHLVDNGAITPIQLERALQRQREQAAKPARLGALLIEQGAISETELARALAQQRDQARAIATAPEPAPASSGGVLIVDDHLAVRDAVRGLIASEASLHVVGEAADAEQALALAVELRPEVILLEHEMPGPTGLEILPRLRGMLPESKVVLFTRSRTIRAEAIARGASAVVFKDEGDAALRAALRRAAGLEPAPATVAAPAARFRRGPARFPHRAVLILAAAVGGYIPAFLIAEPALGPSAAVLGIVSVALAGALLGPGLGIAAAIAVVLATTQLWAATGHLPGETVLQVGGNGLGAISLLFLGATFGAMRTMIDRALDREAVLGHAIIADPTPDGLVAAARAVVPSHAAVLFELSPDLAEARPAAVVGIDGLRDGVDVRAVPALAQCLRERAPVIVGEWSNAFLPQVRSAAFVPLSARTGRAVGVLALFDRRPSHFREGDLRALVALATPAAAALARPVELPRFAAERVRR